jgi:glycosyltransferase involved in cell wall biosynthesis
MKVLVLSGCYPDNNGFVGLNYVHTRDIYYQENGIDVTVLNFAASTGYKKDNIEVITLTDYQSSTVQYDLLIIHAANLRQHFRFLKKYGDNFPKFLFFYHGHEVMRVNHDYAKPYSYKKKNIVKFLAQDIYDSFKIKVWRTYIPTVIPKSSFIFVSNWMLDTFVKNIKIPVDMFEGRYSITYNCVGKDFENLQFDEECEKEYDFITVRANLDGSKYAVDVVNRIAKNTPKAKFLLIGKGDFFYHFEKAPNITWINNTMNHSEIVNALNKSRFALMPTRTDAQGLMMCEMAAFGIPIITSDIPVCHEIFDGFSNASYISNDLESLSLDDFLAKKSKSIKDTRYYRDRTINNELEIINHIGIERM